MLLSIVTLMKNLSQKRQRSFSCHLALLRNLRALPISEMPPSAVSAQISSDAITRKPNYFYVFHWAIKLKRRLSKDRLFLLLIRLFLFFKQLEVIIPNLYFHLHYCPKRGIIITLLLLHSTCCPMAGADTEALMSISDNLRPQKVFRFFEEISAIPRGSGNTAQIAQYCLDFAAQRGLKAVKDNGGNVIIYAPGTAGYENSEPVIIQGHMDMVCEKTADCTKDMDKEGLDLRTDGKLLWAEGTTLGGDDGIAMAYVFALIDSDDIPHPPIEAVITRDEETGMFGAADFEPELVKGKKFINIDSEEEGILTVSCAGGITAHAEIPLPLSADGSDFACAVSVSGLAGGHSGADIHKGRVNAFRALGELLAAVSEKVSFRIASVSGGGKHNVIPQSAEAIITTAQENMAAIGDVIAQFRASFAEKNSANEPDASFSCTPAGNAPAESYDKENTAKLINILANAPTGVQRMHSSIPDMVVASLNIGVITAENNILSVDFLIRGNSVADKQYVADLTEKFVSSVGGKTELYGDYPSWEYREDSPLRELAAETFRELYGKDPVISGIHAGLECGIFSEKIEDSDIISFGPDIHDIHTPSERLDIASAQRTWDFLKEILRKCR